MSQKYRAEYCSSDDPDDVDEPTNCCTHSEPFRPSCWDFSVPFLYVASMAASLLSTIPMGRVTFIWQNRAGPANHAICPLHAAARDREHWGQYGSAACYAATFLPVAPLAIALCLCVYQLAAVVYAERSRQRRSPAGDTAVLVATLVATVLCLAEAGVLTDGVRNTCLGFQMEDFVYEARVRFSSVDEVLSCRQGFDMRDRDHMITAMNTYGQLMAALAGSWLNAALWLALLTAALRRACHWCGQCGGATSTGRAPIKVVRRRRGSQFTDEFPEIARQRRESWV
ncbi:uncharacterized protein LOC122371310 [Amphibalanus amphitrite]|uniref:uncharacterized protein LOC122371310 n=1 Tax=Amphibalanus amphitrite TaxID=1232801 RepID=UPI001C909629|nr:uncharacterized protein LOC122371310 [Amphibalanus amphitrite]